jgi:hypothetical protein
MKFPLVVLAFLAPVSMLDDARAQNALVAPDWNDQATARYLRERQQPGALTGNLTSFRAPLSLPALGLRSGFANTSPAATISGFVDPTQPSPQNWWPACAASIDGVPQTAADDKGTWYSAVYDFKCITVTISGDRNSDQSVPQALRDELSDNKGDSVSTVDEADDQGNAGNIYSVTYDIVRFNVPYTVTIECEDESIAFCKDKVAQKNLLARLSIVAGEPHP